MNRIARILPILVLSIALFGFAASAQAQADVNQFNDRMDMPFTIIDCNGQTLFTIADAHVMVHSVMDSAGGVHLENHTNFHGKDVSFVGGRPTLDIIRMTINFSDNMVAASTSTHLDETHVSASNKADNTVIRTFTHTTVNANGEVTSVKMEAESDCRG